MPPKRKRQAHLTFEPTEAAVSAGQRFVPAKVRYSEYMPTRSSSKTSKSASQVPPANKTQKSLEYSLGKMKSSQISSQAGPSSSHPPAASFMRRVQGLGDGSGRAIASESSDEDVAVEGAVERGEADSDEEADLPPLVELAAPPRSSQSVSTRLKRTVITDDDDEGDDDEDEDDLPIVPSSSRRRRIEAVELESDSDSARESPPKKRLAAHPPSSASSSQPDTTTPATVRTRKLTQKVQLTSSPTKKFKGHRTEKQKKMELLRRRRAGEKVSHLTSSESESEDERKGLYDSDGDDGLEVLKEFSDEEEDEEEAHEPTRKHKAGNSVLDKPLKKSQDDADNSDSNLDDFVVEDDDGPIGAPANISIPLEFTAQAHKPLKEQFPHVIEWLVHNRINPAFERKDPVYNNAWRKLDDEFRGLASSKFTSSAWKAEFYRTLKGRPRLDAWEMDKADAELYDTCEACGRSGHPATWKIIFQGHPYYKDTLAEVESDSEDSGSDTSSRHGSVDSQDQPLPPVTKEWVVGSVCCSNAETAHSLLHWKHALKEWVEDRLEAEGHMTAKKLMERDKMKAKKRREIANRIADAWQTEGTIAALYGDFKVTLENARNKSTTGGRGRRWR